MYLQRLVEFAEANEERFPPLGFKRKKYNWSVNVANDELYFIKAGDQMKEVPDITRSSGTNPILLVDKADYVFGFSAEDASEKGNERAKDRHTAYLALLKKCADETKNEHVAKIYELLNKQIRNFPEDIKEGDFFVFQMDGMDLHQSSDVKAFWANYVKPKVETASAMQCMICGEKGAIMDRHTITFPLGPERTKLVSANATAYESHGLKASRGAPTCYVCEQKYGQALSYLLERYPTKGQSGGPHMFRVGDLTYVYWVRKNELSIDVNGFIQPSTTNPDKAKELVQSVFSGLEKTNQLNNFCILTISANKARMVVRGYEEHSLADVKKNVERFFVAQHVNQDKLYGIYTLAATMYKNPSVQMEKYAINEWVQWFMTGRRLTNRVLIPLLKEIQSSGSMYGHQAAALKSWLVSQNKEEWTVTVNKEDRRASYLCGRLFAVLEKLQQEATRSNNTIASRYFGSASATPQAIFGLLIRNSQAHLNKIRQDSRGTEIYYSRRIQAILKHLDDFPAVLDLKKQAEFALGYYQERQDLYTKQDKKGELANED